MTRLHHSHNAVQLENRTPDPVARPAPIPLDHIDQLNILPASQDASPLTKRTPPGSATSSSSSSPSKSCGPNDNSAVCQKPTDSTSNTTLPIVLGAVIPILVAVVILVILHRRHVKKLKQEDANDRHKSLDFGMEFVDGSRVKKGRKGNKGAPEMTITDTEKSIRRGRGMSMDMGSPYLLPPGLQSSRESLHSLSRTMHSGDDRYRPATTFIPNNESIRSYPSSSRRGPDDSSSFTGSSRRGFAADEAGQNLLRNAQRMSRSMPPTRRTSVTSGNSNPQVQESDEAHTIPRKALSPNPQKGGLAPPNASNQQSSRESVVSDISKDGTGFRNSNNYLGAYIRGGEPFINDSKPTPRNLAPSPPAKDHEPTKPTTGRESPPRPLNTLPSNPRPSQTQSSDPPIEPPRRTDYLDNDYGNAFNVVPPSPEQNTRSPEYDAHPGNAQMPMAEDYDYQPYEPDYGYDVPRLTMGIRPLPPEDPSDNPEQRANRIRSFYKEYFDDSKPGPVYRQEDYYDEYEQDYMYDGVIYDPTSGQFVMGQNPWNEPVTRRAMTPPPRGPPRFQDPTRHQATMSGGGYMSPTGPRAYSSASGRFGPSGRGTMPRKPMPPPAPLRVLPTPHMLKDDDCILPIDFAPPTSFKERRAGTSDSPRGGMRPYSPMLPAHLPLASSFDDLPVMPSPHALRKSGTFTALDFAPPPRFKNSDPASDAGSIRSNRSGMSAVQLHNIRAGSYRVSRIPREVVGTKDDIASSLRPTWNMRDGL